ncbi:hypothetical protein [Mucilaginibacter jinjuensis]|uniref:Uncharacterized protein n=1 Tax=Mucilaginibacter jinjuensis TaxID=1176721 RepID=A0ABY7TE17_9SPHI|nr:hypothetical protein [Mucilaginibacter jinjuensis]WCT14701.1 hypothetical protein PQO05_12220 [Mucilaginibacter jinjuensis]
MKKLFLSAIILLLAVSVHAQVGGTPRQLTCTEEAFNFKVGIKSGWHFGQVSMGPSGLPQNIPVRSFNEQAPVTQQFLSGKVLLLTSSRNTVNLRMPDNLKLFAPDNYQFDKLNYKFPYRISVPTAVQHN